MKDMKDVINHIAEALGDNSEQVSEVTITKSKFDFEIGHLVKSPCKECTMRNNFPGCSKDCKLLMKIQTILSGGISSENSFSPLESYSISLRGNVPE